MNNTDVPVIQDNYASIVYDQLIISENTYAAGSKVNIRFVDGNDVQYLFTAIYVASTPDTTVKEFTTQADLYEAIVYYLYNTLGILNIHYSAVLNPLGHPANTILLTSLRAASYYFQYENKPIIEGGFSEVYQSSGQYQEFMASASTFGNADTDLQQLPGYQVQASNVYTASADNATIVVEFYTGGAPDKAEIWLKRAGESTIELVATSCMYEKQVDNLRSSNYGYPTDDQWYRHDNTKNYLNWYPDVVYNDDTNADYGINPPYDYAVACPNHPTIYYPQAPYHKGYISKFFVGWDKYFNGTVTPGRAYKDQIPQRLVDFKADTGLTNYMWHYGIPGVANENVSKGQLIWATGLMTGDKIALKVSGCMVSTAYAFGIYQIATLESSAAYQLIPFSKTDLGTGGGTGGTGGGTGGTILPPSKPTYNYKTFSFSFNNQAWIAKHTYKPEGYTQLSEKLLLHLSDTLPDYPKAVAAFINKGSYGTYLGTIFQSYIEYVEVIEKFTAAVLDNIRWWTKAKQVSGITPFDTINALMVTTAYQCTGIISLPSWRPELTVAGYKAFLEAASIYKLNDGSWQCNMLVDEKIYSDDLVLDNNDDLILNSVSDKAGYKSGASTPRETAAYFGHKPWYVKDNLNCHYFKIRLIIDNITQAQIGMYKIEITPKQK